MITVTICTADRYDYLSDLMQHLLPQISSNKDYRLLIVDSSQDISKGRSFAQSLFLPGQLVYLPGSEQGLSAAKNIAISVCSTRYLAYIDDDAIPSPDWLRNILDAFRCGGKNCAAAGGKIEPLWLSPRPPWLPDELLPYLSILDLGSDTHVLQAEEHLYGTNIAYRLSDLKSSGGFRTDLGRTRTLLLSNEETNLQQRLVEKGRKVIYSPDIVVKHKISAERLTKQWFYNRLFWQAFSDQIEHAHREGTDYKIPDKYKNTPACPTSLIKEELSHSPDPQIFLQQCASIYKQACRILENENMH